jgi:hypothetical protein
MRCLPSLPLVCGILLQHHNQHPHMCVAMLPRVVACRGGGGAGGTASPVSHVLCHCVAVAADV